MKRFAMIMMASAITVGTGLAAAAAHAQIPTDRPFSMRGVELGITIDEFREEPIPNDDNRYRDLQFACANGDELLSDRIYLSSEDKELGVVECRWYSNRASIRSNYPLEHWVNIGNGGGWPTFRFIESEGELRLFQITFYANNQYHADILDALTRGYGQAEEQVDPFKTQIGAEFTSLTSVWDNGLSSITLVEKCGHLERYCLTYEHSEIAKIYAERREALASEAASRI